MVSNPLGAARSAVNSAVGTGLSDIDMLIDSGLATPEELTGLETIKAVFNDASSAAGDMFSHADTLLFGDNQGSLISGGIGSNAGQALSAINLEDTLDSLGGAITETCDLIMDFFGSVLGAGKDLLDALADAVSQAVQFISNAISAAVGGLAAAIQAIVGAISTIIGAITSAISAIVSLIANELATFAEWLAKQLDFSLGNFLAGAQDNPCLQLLLGGVGTAALVSILS